MYNTSKICDAADWFDPEVKLIIEKELREPARLHRKQWEFAMIFLTLKKFGLLTGKEIGLSLGGGTERILYSLTEHVKKLFVTDLYDNNTSWDCARTANPDDFIKSNKPFPYDEEKLQALRMDMRHLEFENNTFDFCYSSCAIEHIGGYNDFLNHLNEVNRVLKKDGIYVFTTEFQFGEQTIADPNNYIFNKDFISELIRESHLDFISDVNLDLTKNEVNYPIPSNIKHISFIRKNHISEKLFDGFPHLILLRGNVPFTSVLLILKKGRKGKRSYQPRFINYDSTRKFLLEGIERYRKLIDSNKISISPFSSLPEKVSRFFTDHSDYFAKSLNGAENEATIFHSDYFWFGKGKRNIEINLKVDEAASGEQNIIQLRVHSYPIHNSSSVNCIYEKSVTVHEMMQVDETIVLNTEEGYNYAFLCKLISGDVSFSSVLIESDSNNQSDNHSSHTMELEGVILT